ncbi:MAG: ribosomal S27a family protein [Tenericutes bacterium]|nr:ribosomal S27a family protein [Mycoplasmatota bacterium]
MKKLLTFIPLGIGISSAIIYVFNVISFKAINNTIAMSNILYNLKAYLYISVVGFVLYGLIKLIFFINERNTSNNISCDVADKKEEVIKEDETEENKIEKESIEDNTIKNLNEVYTPNYDYVPLYKKEDKVNNDIPAYEPFEVEDNLNKNNSVVKTEVKNEEKVSVFKKYCTNCGALIDGHDKYCGSCGYDLYNQKKKNTVLSNILNVLEIVILILIIYFSLNMLFSYKEKTDPNFESPFNIKMTE